MCLPEREDEGPSGACGFTLVEVLVAISIIALLIALALPALSGARGSAQRLKSLTNLRTIGQAFELYSGGGRGLCPAPVEGRFYPMGWCPGVSGTMPWWEATSNWPGLVAEVLPWPANAPGVFLAPGAVRDFGPGVSTCGLPPSYSYSASFLGRPELWRPGAPADPGLQKGVSTHEVVFPASKVMLWDWELPYLRRELRSAWPDLAERTPMLFADGHGEERVPAEAAAPVPNPLPGVPEPTARLHNTPDGVRGRDY